MIGCPMRKIYLSLGVFARCASCRNTSGMFVGSALSVPGPSPGGISSGWVRPRIAPTRSGFGSFLGEAFFRFGLAETLLFFVFRSFSSGDEAGCFLSFFSVPIFKRVLVLPSKDQDSGKMACYIFLRKSCRILRRRHHEALLPVPV